MNTTRTFFSWIGTLGVLFCCLAGTSHAQSFKVDTLHFSGDVYERINFVILGDGYLETQLDKFYDDAFRMQARVLAEEPLKNYRNYINVFSISVPSMEEGAANDPSMPIANYFGSTFNYAGIQRLLVPLNDGVIMNVLADHTPWYSQAFMMVNDTRYGGSGGWVATSSTALPATEIAYHEIGHSFADLNDEYWAGSQYARENVNMTANNDPETVPWWMWIGDHQIGVYEYESPGNGWYRPANGCKMQILGAPFCAVCKEQFVNTILSYVQFVRGWYPEVLDVGVVQDEPIEFGVEVLQTTSESMSTTWYVDEEPVLQNSSTFVFDPLSTNIADHTITATTQENTDMLRNNTYSWNVTWQVTTTVTDVVETRPYRLHLQVENPVVSSELHYSVKADTESSVEVVVVDLHGNAVASQTHDINSTVSLGISHLPNGVYILQAVSNRGRVSAKFIKQ